MPINLPFLRRAKVDAKPSVKAGPYGAANPYQPFRFVYGGLRSKPVDEDTAARWDRQRLRLECRDLYRNNEIVSGVVKRFQQYAIGVGIRPQARTSNETWNTQAEKFWNRTFAPWCDVRQRPGCDLVGLQKMALASLLLDGEMGFVLLSSGKIQPVEAERIATPEQYKDVTAIVDGIKIDKQGRPQGYFVCDRADDGTVSKESFSFVQAADFVHVTLPPWRPDMLRAVPGLTAVIDKLRDVDETDRYVLNKAKSDAQNLYKRKTSLPGINEAPRNTAAPDMSAGPRVQDQDWGTVYDLLPNEDIEPFESKTPNGEYVPYLQFQLKLIASALGLPIEFLLLEFDSSFSASRAAMINFLSTMGEWHGLLVTQMMQRLWNWRIAKAIKNGELPAAPITTGESEWNIVEWTQPYQDWIDPQKQVAAARDSFNLGTSSLKAIIHSQGGDVDEVLEEKAVDIRRAIRIASQVNQEFPGANLTWRDIINSQPAGSAPLPVADTQPGSDGGTK